FVKGCGKKRKTCVYECRHVLLEMYAQTCDVLRLSIDRRACKLLILQKQCSHLLVDSWDMTKSFRNGDLDTLDTT
uniref:Uncharacterized protein n=1 Tax=Bos indicus x Bos taurus TaxID=30522 RepID=A0A4W2C1G6_BOBOX